MNGLVRTLRAAPLTLTVTLAIATSSTVSAGHWADENGQCRDESGEPTACKWGQMYWGDGQTYSPPLVAPQIEAKSDGSEDISFTLLNLMQGSQNGWSAITYFRVECNGLPAQIIDANNPRLTGLEPETTYSCLIYAGNDLGLGDQPGQFTVTTDAESGGGLPVWALWAALNPDPYFSNVVLLLNAEETGAAQDQGSFNHEVSLRDNAVISSTSKFGGGAYQFDGDLDYISLPDSTSLDLATDNWTVEFWLKSTQQVDRYNYVLSSPHGAGLSITTHSETPGRENKLSVTVTNCYGSPDCYIAYTLSDINLNDGDWYFLSTCRQGNSLMTWVDGQLLETSPFSDASVGVNLANGRVGRFIDSFTYNNFHGWVDDFRVTAGVCRYSGNFSPPTRAFPTR